MKTKPLKSLLTLALLLSALAAEAGRASWDVSSNIDLTTRIFTEDARWQGQDDSTAQLSIAGSSEFRYRGDESRASDHFPAAENMNGADTAQIDRRSQ